MSLSSKTTSTASPFGCVNLWVKMSIPYASAERRTRRPVGRACTYERAPPLARQTSCRLRSGCAHTCPSVLGVASSQPQACQNVRGCLSMRLLRSCSAHQGRCEQRRHTRDEHVPDMQPSARSMSDRMMVAPTLHTTVGPENGEEGAGRFRIQPVRRRDLEPRNIT
jgi:hypothetical protein